MLGTSSPLRDTTRDRRLLSYTKRGEQELATDLLLSELLPHHQQENCSSSSSGSGRPCRSTYVSDEDSDDCCCREISATRQVLELQDDRRDGTALFWAATRGNDDLVDLLLTFGARVNSRTANGSTPLHSAAEKGHVTIVR